MARLQPKLTVLIPQEKSIPPIVQYMHKLVYNDLNRHTVKNILKQLRKLPWDSENEAQILDTFVKLHKGKYGNIHVVASLASALSQYHDSMGTKLIDTLLRNIIHGLEVLPPLIVPLAAL